MQIKLLLLACIAGLAVTVAANPDAESNDAVLDLEDDFGGDIEEYAGEDDDDDDDDEGGLVARGLNPISGLPVPKKPHHHKHKKHHKHHKGHKKHHKGHKKHHKHGKKKHYFLPRLKEHACPGDLCGVPVPYKPKYKVKGN